MNPYDRCNADSLHSPATTLRRMMRLAFVLAMSATVAACADTLTGPKSFAGPNGDGPSPDLLPGEAEAVAVQTIFQNDDINTCRGEPVHTEGTVNSFFHVTVVDPTKYRIKVHYNTEGNTGVTLTTPAVAYKVIEVDNFEEQFDATLPTQYEYTTNVQLRREGEDPSIVTPGDDYYLHINMHVKFDAMGVPTVTASNIKTDCR
jgi:hypothetical protein